MNIRLSIGSTKWGEGVGRRAAEWLEEEILGAAWECAREYGPLVTVAQVAERAGVSAATLIQRYRSKGALLEAALRPSERNAFLNPLQRAWGDAPMKEGMAWISTQVTHLLADGLPLLCVGRSAPGAAEWRGVSAMARQFEDAIVAFLKTYLEQQREQGRVAVEDTLSVARAWAAALEAIARDQAQNNRPSGEVQAACARVAALFCRALGNPGSRSR